MNETNERLQMTESFTDGASAISNIENADNIPPQNQGEASDCPLVYKVSDRPPVHAILLFGFQQAVISIAHQLVVSLLVAEVVCASDDSEFKTQLLSSTLFMTGLTTLLMVTIGIRLPVFQGAAIEYLSPLLLLGTVDSTFCMANVAPARRHCYNHYYLMDMIVVGMNMGDGNVKDMLRCKDLDY